MKNFLAFIFKIFLFIFLFFSCKNNSKVEKITENRFLGVWYSANSNLKIESDSTFLYTRFTCVSQLISYGKWIIQNDTLVLKNDEPKGCYYFERWIIKPPVRNDTINKKHIKNCEINSGFVSINNEKFYIQKNELKYLGRQSDSILSDDVLYNFGRIRYLERDIN